MNTHHELIILGSGPAAYTAAIYAARANLKPLLISGQANAEQPAATHIENWPGYPSGVQGADLMNSLREQAERFDTETINDEITEVSLIHRPFTLTGQNTYTADALIIATGSSVKYLGLNSEAKFLGKGVSLNATSDGYLYKNQPVAVVGGGNSAVKDALFLSNIASHVTLVHRRATLKAEKALQERLLKKIEDGKISLKRECTVQSIFGDEDGLNRVDIGFHSVNTEETLKVRALFISIGHSPNTEIFNNQIDMYNGYITVFSGIEGGETLTSVSGVFAAGEVIDPYYRQPITSSASGCQAALDAEQYLAKLKN